MKTIIIFLTVILLVIGCSKEENKIIPDTSPVVTQSSSNDSQTPAQTQEQPGQSEPSTPPQIQPKPIEIQPKPIQSDSELTKTQPAVNSSGTDVATLNFIIENYKGLKGLINAYNQNKNKAVYKQIQDRLNELVVEGKITIAQKEAILKSL